MMNDIAYFIEEIKQMVSAKQVFEFYGFNINRAGFCSSPFSAIDKTPSLKVYEGERGWHDFSSGNGGDVIDFVQLYFGLPVYAACVKLNDDFRLGLPIGQTLSRQERIEADRKAQERRRKAQERKDRADRLQQAFDKALTDYAALDIVARENAPQGPETPLSECNDSWAAALRGIAGAAYDLTEAEGNLYRERLEKR